MSQQADTSKGYVAPPRLDRFFPLADAVGYPGTNFLDVLIWTPRTQPGRRLRVWLRTDAQAPEVEMPGKRRAPAGRSEYDPEWLDFGLIEPESEELGTRGFTRAHLHGVSPEEARDSCLLLTGQVEAQPAGAVPEVERQLLGVARQDAGSSTITPGRVTVGRPTTFAMTYTAGPGGLPAGAILRLSFALAFSLPQTAEPDSPGFLEAVEPAVPVELLAIARSIETHEGTDVFYALPRGLAPGARLTFRYRTAFTYRYATRREEAERRYWWSHLPPMAVAVGMPGHDGFVALAEGNGHAVEFAAGPPSRLHLFLPGRVAAAAGLSLRGLYTDEYRNLPSPGPVHPDLHLRVVGEKPVELGSAGRHLTRWYRFAVSLPELAPGVYRAQAYDPASGQVLAESNPMEILAPGDARSPVFWGEIHGHTEQSDGSGSYEGLFQHARDEGCLDFTAAADHACYHTDNEWQWMQDTANAFNDEGRFATLIGYEWAGDQGHRNVYTSGDRLDLFRGMDTRSHSLDVVYRHFAGREDVVAGPHVHHVGRDFFAHHHPEVQRFFEIYSMWGPHERLVFDALNHGAVIGVTGGGDCHEGRAGFSVEDREGQGVVPHTFAPGLKWKCGMTGALLPRLTRQALVAALRERRTYATTGPRILLDFRVGDAPMGGEWSADGARVPIEAEVHATARIATLEVIRDGDVVHALRDAGPDVALRWQDDAPEGRHWYLLKVTQADGEMAWSSPIWVR